MAVKVKQRKGKWWVYIDHKGQRRARCVGDKRTAERVAETIRAKLALGDIGVLAEKEHRPFSSYYCTWLDTYVRAHCKPATYVSYEVAFRLYLSPAFGDKDVQAITREEVKGLAYGMLSQGRARATVRATLAPLRAMFAHAVEDGHATSNPSTRILKRSRRDAGTRRASDFLTREELAHLLACCREHFPRQYPFVLLLARTGMRVGEAVALQWDDIDWHGRFAEVRRSMGRDGAQAPKSGKSRRVDLSAQLIDVLRTLRVNGQKQALREGHQMPPWVFASESGTPLDANNLRHRVWPRLFSKAELRQVRIHDLRHTYASLLIAQGESLTYVKEQLGHASIQTTVDVYGHLVPGGNRAAVDRLDDAPTATTRNLSATAASVSD